MATYSSSNNSGYPIGVSLLVMLCVSLYIFDTFENGYLTKLKIESQRYFRGRHIAPQVQSHDANTTVRKCQGSERAEHLQQQCERLGSTHYDELLDSAFDSDVAREITGRMHDSLRIDDNHKLILCLPSKAGTTTFKSLLVKYSDLYINQTQQSGRIKPHSINYLSTYGINAFKFLTKPEAIRRLETYTKILVVRHPLVRLFSAYRQKLSGNASHSCDTYQRRMARQIVMATRGHVTPEQQICVRDLTFAEFVRYFVSNINTSFVHNRHWDQYENVCHACHIKYDHVIKLETGHSDELMLIDKFLNTEQKAETDLFIRNNESVLDEDTLALNNYQQVYPEFRDVTTSDFEALVNFYRDEMQRYGYRARLTDRGLETSCQLTINGQTCC